jgi:hypothetical protein
VTWSFRIDTTEEIDNIILDPNNALPDIDSENNIWTSATGEMEKDVPLDLYTGTYSSLVTPVKIVLTDDKNGHLIISATGQPSIPMKMVGKDKFALAGQAFEIQFEENKKSFELNVDGQKVKFIRD